MATSSPERTLTPRWTSAAVEGMRQSGEIKRWWIEIVGKRPTEASRSDLFAESVLSTNSKIHKIGACCAIVR
jgi:hypothetical protein